MRTLHSILSLVLLTSCIHSTTDLPEVQPPQTINAIEDSVIALSPTHVQKTINNTTLSMYGYNGQIPGPLITAKQGTTVSVDVRNDIDMDTTIHWHGIRLENSNDGVPDVTQDPIAPGQSFRYMLNLPDEGIYWYHPHVREDIQQDKGLYGNLFVKPNDPHAYGPVNQEEFVILDDLLIDEEGKNIPYGDKDANFPLMGRFGNAMLINGEPADGYTVETSRGSVVRFYITNVANTRTFRIRIDGGAMKRVGSDVGRYEREEWIDLITIAPAERYIVDVLFEDDGRYKITHDSPLATFNLGTVLVTTNDAAPSYTEAFHTLKENDDVTKDIDSFRDHFNRPVDKTILLSVEFKGTMANMDHSMMMEHSDDGIEWEDTMPFMNKIMGKDDLQWKLIDEESGEENMDFMYEFQQGDIVKIRLINQEEEDGSAHPMHHPIHFHGQRFLVLSIDGKQNKNHVWKDTVLVPTGSTVDLLFDMSNPGDWMFHCHIAEHLTNGMMGMFRVNGA